MNFFHKRNYVCHAIIIHADVDKQGFVIKMKNDYIYSRSFATVYFVTFRTEYVTH